MRFRMAVSFATFFLFCFAIAVWTGFAATPDAGSAIGKISSVGETAFSLDVAKTSNSNNPNTLQFVIDGSTKVQGRLAVGASATVEYRSDDGKLVANLVVVMPPAGL